MELPPIVQAFAPVLRARAEDVPTDRIKTPELQQLFEVMIRVMRAAPGVGLAAPQIGVPWRVMVLEDRAELLATLSAADRKEREREPFETRVIVNPVVKPIGSETRTFLEGCLSVKGHVALVERAREVEVTGFDEHAAPVSWRVSGWPARILQHEGDHLDGTLYVDRMLTRSFATDVSAKEHYAGKSVAELRAMLGI